MFLFVTNKEIVLIEVYQHYKSLKPLNLIAHFIIFNDLIF